MAKDIQISDLVVFHKRMPSKTIKLGLVLDTSCQNEEGKRMLLIGWGTKKNTKHNQSIMIRLWVYEEEVEVVSYGANRGIK
jgi:hypothetical protein